MKHFTKIIPLMLVALATSCSGFADLINGDSGDTVSAERVDIPQSSFTIYEGRTLQLNANVYPLNATNKQITWSSSDSSILSVNNSGLVSLGSEATIGESATITVTTKDGGHTDKCTVTIKQRDPNIDEWTILLYMCGADLESQLANVTEVYDDEYHQYVEWDGVGLATKDINEILAVPNKPNDVNIVIQTGGASDWTKNSYGHYGSYDIRADRLQRHHVENGQIVLDASMNYASMGYSSTLQSFIEYGLTNYPADKTALILWNHGGGLQGVCFDERKNGDGLEIDEVISAVSNALSRCDMAGQKLEFIGYDACLMQIQDIAIRNSNYFNYMVGAQETESGYGWNYTSWIDDLYAKKPTTTVLKAIVDGFIDDNGGVNDRNNDQTLSYLDLAHASEYQYVWENLASKLRNKITSYNSSSFASLVKGSKYFGGETYGAYGLFDVKSFLNKLSSSSTFNVDASVIKAVNNTLKYFVPYAKCGKGAGNANGLSMYYAVFAGGYASSDYNYYRLNKETTLTNWNYIVSTYGESGWY